MLEPFTWEDVKKDIEQINKIVSTCDDKVKEKCFEMLFNLKWGQVKIESVPEKEKIPLSEARKEFSDIKTNYHLKGNVLAMLRKSNLDQKDLEKLFMLDHEPIMPVYKLDGSKTATAQVQKVFMILLENALSSGQFKVGYSEIRDTCKEDGLWDKNFATNLKKQAEYFKGAISKTKIDEEGSVELTGSGMDKLAEIIKQLSQKNEK